MAALPMPVYGLDKLYLFPYYQTRAQYRAATGVEAPEFNPNRPPKSWFDPNAGKDTRRSVVYDQVVAYDENGSPIRDEAGNPTLEPLILTKVDASTVNIPLKEGANEPGADVPEIPVPLRALDPDEEIFFDKLSVIRVKNKKLYDTLDTTYNAQDRALLQAIARKLNVVME